MLDPTTVIGFLARSATFAAILLVVGAVVFRSAVVARASLSPGTAALLRRRAAHGGAWGAAMVLPAGLGRLFVQTAGMRFPGDPWRPTASRLVLKTGWGHVWMAQMVLGVFLVLALARAMRLDADRWLQIPLALFALMFATTPSLASHAMSAHASRGLTVSADMLHVLGAGVWIGTLIMLLFALRLPPTEDRDAAMLLARFSPVALTGAATIVASGAVSSLAHVGRIGMLTSTPYGRVLMVKVALVGIVAFVGWRNWRHLTLWLDRPDVATLRRSIVFELLVAALVLAVTAVLIVTPPPMEGM